MSKTSSLPLFDALDQKGSGYITQGQILKTLTDAGIQLDDPRITGLLSGMQNLKDSEKIRAKDFSSFGTANLSLLDRVVKRELVIPDFSNFAEKIKQIFEQTEKNESGAVASYIPQLARVNPEQFAVSICTIDGQRLSLGNSDAIFGFQSTCKPFLYCAAMEQHGEKKVHEHVGREPSGVSFNELTLNKANRPHNPMINAGAIMSSSLIWSELPMADRFENVVNMMSSLAGGSRPGFDNAIYHSEKDTADRNFALAHYMREVGAFPEDTDIHSTLEMYFACCSMETTSEVMATTATTLANGGVCVDSGERVYTDDTVKNCLSLMSSCGMYDYSGEFAFRVGLPAKSGVSGAVMVVIPNLMGITVWSPRLDAMGNSVRGVEFIEHLTENFNFHNFDSLVKSTKCDPRKRNNGLESNSTFLAIDAASRGDLAELRRLVSFSADLGSSDYDGRTPLHLAAAEGQEAAVEYLLRKGVEPAPKDRWGFTPMDDAKRHKKQAVINQFESVQVKAKNKKSAA